MELLFIQILKIALVVMLIGVPVYLHAVRKFGNIIQVEHPEWIVSKGSLSFFYSGMPRSADPNVVIAILGVAFSSRWRTLESPLVAKYVGRIRFLLPSILAIFGTFLFVVVVFKP